MDVLVVGGGGREHALVWKIAQSPRVKKIYCAPGNPGIQKSAEGVEIRPDDLAGLAAFAEKKGIDLTIVGPELPLVSGIVDFFQGRRLRIFGPSALSARIEGSKIFAKDLMARCGIPTALWEGASSPEEAVAAVKKRGFPCVIKADGLAQGKGVFVVRQEEEASQAIDLLLKKKVFGKAGERVVVEEYLTGREVTVLAFVDGRTVCPMPPSVDHKAVFDGGSGPNTGGMGAYTPISFMSPALHGQIINEIIRPILREVDREGGVYKGVLYVGLMVSHGVPYVLEFNARFGDPEAQVLLPLLENDLVEIMEAVLDGQLEKVRVCWKEGAALCVVLASKGYPGSYEVGKTISGLDEAEKMALLFHAGTAWRGGQVVTQGGRVLNVVALAPHLVRAREMAYGACRRIHFDGIHFRGDIGACDDVS